MLKAIIRWFRSFGQFIGGSVDNKRRQLDTNPQAIRARYDEIISNRMTQISEYKRAIARLISQEQKRVAVVRGLEADINNLSTLRAGALAKAKKLSEDLKGEGKSADEIKQHIDYQRCLGAYRDFSSTISEKSKRVAELQEALDTDQSRISEHKSKLMAIARDLEKLKSESAEAVAEIITAKQEREISDALIGIANDPTERDLQELRDMRQEARAEVRVSRELAGTDTSKAEQEFMEYALDSEAQSEFDVLLGLADLNPDYQSSRNQDEESAVDNRLPE